MDILFSYLIFRSMFSFLGTNCDSFHAFHMVFAGLQYSHFEKEHIIDLPIFPNAHFVILPFSSLLNWQ